MRIPHPFFALSLFLAIVFALAIDSFAETPMVHDAWVRQPPPSSRITAGYLVIHNAGGSAARLVNISTPLAARVEVHETTINEEGTALMRKVDELVIQPGEVVKLAPGGLHLMIMGLKGPISAGEKFPLELSFKEGGVVKVEAEVRGKTPSSPQTNEDTHDHHHDH